MRSLLALGLLVTTLCASLDAATAHRFRSHRAHPSQRVAVPRDYYYPAQGAVGTKSFAVPGWTEEETAKWLYDASAGSGKY
jgi:hypothetical protein